MELNDHACDLACKRGRLRDVHLVADDVLNEREDEVTNLHAPLLLRCHLAQSTHQLLVAWSVERLDALDNRYRDNGGCHRPAFKRRPPSSEVVLGWSRCLLNLSLLHLLFSKVGNQLDQSQQELSLLCLQLLADAFQLLHGALVFKVLEMAMEL